MPRNNLVPIIDLDSAIGAGWFIEVDGRRVAELTEPMYESGSQFWYSYVIVPTQEEPDGMAASVPAKPHPRPTLPKNFPPPFCT